MHLQNRRHASERFPSLGDRRPGMFILCLYKCPPVVPHVFAAAVRPPALFGPLSYQGARKLRKRTHDMKDQFAAGPC